MLRFLNSPFKIDNMNIRPCQKEDLAQCEEIFNLPELYTASGKNLSAEFIVNYLNDKYFLVAQEAGKIVGAIYGEPLKAGGAVVWAFGVLSNWRGQGIGSALLKAFEDNARADDRHWTVLYAPAKSDKTVKFYKQHSYYIGQGYLECAKDL